MSSNLIMGVVNVTPDSFSDGGRFFKPEDAVDQVLRLVDDGADIVDIGAESSRPGAELITPEIEWQRLEPVLEKLFQRDIGCQISIDTNKDKTMLRLQDYPISIINDIKGGASQSTLEALAAQDMTYIAMHMHQTPSTMQIKPLDGQEAVDKVEVFYTSALDRLKRCGFSEDRIWLDPGIGFGKTDCANIALIKFSMERAKKWPIVVGVSRKSFIGRLLGIDNPKERDHPSKMLELALMLAPVKAIRTHDVAKLRLIRDHL